MAAVAVAILNYNGKEHLKTFLPSVITYSVACDIIVGDNGSTDGSLNLLANQFPQVRVIKLDRNYGFAGGYNRLIEQLDHEVVILANSDIEVTPGWTQPLLEVLESDDKIVAVQPKILSYTNKHMFEHAGAGGGYMDKYGFPFCRGRVFDSIEEDKGQYDDQLDVFWASGACFAIKREAFEELGGFAERFFAHMEEIDLDWRLLNKGYRIVYTGDSTVYHLGGGTLQYDNPRKTFLNFRNSWFMLIRNSTAPGKITIFFNRWLLDLASISFFLIQFKALSAWAVIRAHMAVLINLRKLVKEHKQLTISAKNNSKIQPAKFSLAWQYFIKKRKGFQELIPD